MFNKIEYTFTYNGCVHVLQTKPSGNSKIGMGYVVQTYHFAEEQVRDNNFTDDTNTCFDCPYSYNQNNGKSGGCYTHKGMQYVGLKSMLNRLNKLYHNNSIKPLDPQQVKDYLSASKYLHPKVVRFGAYGEPVLLPLNLVGKLYKLAPKTTGYTHQWHKPLVSAYSKYLMASCHSVIEASVANSMGWRGFVSVDKSQLTAGAICPAAKEFKGHKKTCVECGACNGRSTGRTNNIFINKH